MSHSLTAASSTPMPFTVNGSRLMVIKVDGAHCRLDDCGECRCGWIYRIDDEDERFWEGDHMTATKAYRWAPGFPDPYSVIGRTGQETRQ